MCWSIASRFSQTADSFALVFTSCLCRSSRTSIKKTLRSLRVFPEHVDNYRLTALTCTWFSRFPGKCQSYSQPYNFISFPNFSFQAFCLACCLSQLLFTTSGSHKVQQLPLSVSDKGLWKKGLSNWVKVK